MFVDASALVSLIANEGDAADLLDRLLQTGRRATSPLAVWETTVAITRMLNVTPENAEALVTLYLAETAIEVVDVPAEISALALEAHRRFGKGRHPAALNFGDCFAYACARHHKVPLLFKGNDFSQTDIESA